MRAIVDGLTQHKWSTRPNQPYLLHEHVWLSGSRFVDVDLSDSVFDDVNLQRATFENVALTGARFRNVNLSQVSLEEGNLEGMKINGVLVAELFRVYQNKLGQGQ